MTAAISAQTMRLKQVPIDIWSTKEKLCLASSVLRSGDQNWHSVSRSLKTFGEPNRPADWFSQKNCALQYSDLLEKVETPKRKRGERGEETAQDLIVRRLTAERIEELKKSVEDKKEVVKKLKIESDSLRQSICSEQQAKEIWQRMQDEIKDKEAAEIVHKKWLEERETKIAAMKANRHGVLALSIKQPKTTSASTVSTHSTSSLSIKTETTDGEPIVKPSSVETPIVLNQDEGNTVDSKAGANQATSPMLTSLLQNSSNSADASKLNDVPPNNLTSEESEDAIKSSPQPNLSPTDSSANNVPQVMNTSESVTADTCAITKSLPLMQQDQSTLTSTNSNSSTLSKLLEVPAEAAENLTSVLDGQQINDIEVVSSTTSTQTSEGIQVVDNDLKSKSDSMSSEETEIKDDDNSINEVSEVDEQTKEIDGLDEMPADDRGIGDSVKDENSSSAIEKEIKQECLEVINETAVVTIKQEASQDDELESTYNAAESEVSKTPTTTASRGKRRRMITPMNTPTMTRRSGRVKAIKDQKGTDDTEVSLHSNEGETQFKKSLVAGLDETTDASVSEESMDAIRPVNKAPSISESVPNSPASTIHNEDSEKEYKAWKKSIMILWKTAATHKFASLFLHPVTNDEAAGYTTVVYRPIDLASIRKRIESGSIRTTAEFQRDILLMFQNAIMYNSCDHDVHQMAVEMQKEIVESVEDFIESQQQTSQANESKLRGRERRSGIATPVTEMHDPDSTNVATRRKSRTSTDTEPGGNTPTTSKTKVKKKV